MLFIYICRANIRLSWRSKLHDDGTVYDGWFIAGIKTPLGMATYHLPIAYWDAMEDVKVLEKAPKWDGHTPDDVLKRIASLGT